MSQEAFKMAFDEIQAVCRKHDLAAAVFASDGKQTQLCYGLDWAKWSRAKQIDANKIGVPITFKGRADAEDYLPTGNMMHSFAEAGALLSQTLFEMNHGAALKMRDAIQREERQARQ